MQFNKFRVCVVAVSLVVFAVRASAQVDMLPDMVPWVSEASRYQYRGSLDADFEHVRFTTAPLNIGTGDLRVRNTGRTDESGERQIVEQVIEVDTDGDGQPDTFRVRDAGYNIYHPTHNHIHFDGYAQQRLRRVTAENGIGEILAEGAKISFCLIDLDNFSSDEGPKFISCGGIDGGEWGISAGWADIYSSGLAGQEINVQSLARSGTQFLEGEVWLEIEIDVDNQMLESDETNNIAHIKIDLNNRTSGRSFREIDDHGNTTASATRIVADAPQYRYGYINNDGDVDMYTFDTFAGVEYEITYRELQLATGSLTLLDPSGVDELLVLDAGADGYQTISGRFVADGGSYFLAAGEVGTMSSMADGSFQVWVTTVGLVGDFNSDGFVDAADYSVWRDLLGQTGTDLEADANDDGVVDTGDYDLWRQYFGNSLPTTDSLLAAAVPEPASSLLAAGGMLLIAVGSRLRSFIKQEARA
jgi:hypothetical protein